jgi:NADP-dependent 3-hydroxy acid dehydrogenase YdfG
MAQTTVLVTGGSRGIGRAIALRFAREGARVAVCARSSDQLDAVVAEIDAAGGQGLAVQMDITDVNGAESSIFRACDFFEGPIDVLVNNAGIFGVHPFEDLNMELWQRYLDVNLTGAYVITLEAMGSLRESERGHIFNVSSTAGQQGFAGSVAYCATKYGLRGFGDALREELADTGIRVSTIYPGTTDTTIFDGVPGEWDRSAMNQPEDVAEVIWTAYNAPADADVADIDVPPPA